MTQQRFVFEPVKTLQDAPGTVKNSRDTPRNRPTTPRDQSTAAQDRPRTPQDPPRRNPPAVLNGSEVFVRNPRARRYVVRVRADGVVRVTIPRGGSRRRAIDFLQQQQAWIATELERAERERAQPRNLMPPEMVNALRQQARRDLPPRLMALATKFGLTVARVTIRSQRWRWGSCSRNGCVSLNWRLVTMPDWVRDYVLIHELMHLKRMDHSPKFWAHVAKACPNYEEARAWLTKFKTFPPPA